MTAKIAFIPRIVQSNQYVICYIHNAVTSDEIFSGNGFGRRVSFWQQPTRVALQIYNRVGRPEPGQPVDSQALRSRAFLRAGAKPVIQAPQARADGGGGRGVWPRAVIA